jgi:hypothetical protein
MLTPSSVLQCAFEVFADLRRQVALKMLPRAGPSPEEIFVEKQPLYRGANSVFHVGEFVP